MMAKINRARKVDRARANRALGVVQRRGAVCIVNPTLAWVNGSADEPYKVTWDQGRGWRCSCPDSRYRRERVCKHVLAVVVKLEMDGWIRLPAQQMSLGLAA